MDAGDDCTIEGDDLIVEGGRPRGGGMVATHMDHRIAMSFLIMGMATLEPMAVDDVAMITTSFPAFRPTMERLRAQFREARPRLFQRRCPLRPSRQFYRVASR